MFDHEAAAEPSAENRPLWQGATFVTVPVTIPQSREIDARGRRRQTLGLAGADKARGPHPVPATAPRLAAAEDACASAFLNGKACT